MFAGFKACRRELPVEESSFLRLLCAACLSFTYFCCWGSLLGSKISIDLPSYECLKRNCHFAAGTVTSGVVAKLDKVIEGQTKLIKSQTKLVELYEAKVVKQYRFREGKTGKAKAVGIALNQLGLTSEQPGKLPTRWPRGYTSYKFTPYVWPDEKDEEKETPKLRSTMKQSWRN